MGAISPSPAPPCGHSSGSGTWLIWQLPEGWPRALLEPFFPPRPATERCAGSKALASSGWSERHPAPNLQTPLDAEKYSHNLTPAPCNAFARGDPLIHDVSPSRMHSDGQRARGVSEWWISYSDERPLKLRKCTWTEGKAQRVVASDVHSRSVLEVTTARRGMERGQEAPYNPQIRAIMLFWLTCWKKWTLSYLLGWI